MEFALLGPIEVRRDGEPLPLGGPKQRGLLAMLLLYANQAVSRDRLIEALWGERPPPRVDQSLDSYISRLRRVLGPDRLRRHPPGYVLRVEPDELDVNRFERLIARARVQLAEGDAPAARQALDVALALWRGPALADVLDEPFAAVEAARLEERRLLAVEEQIEAELTTGAGGELVPQLERLVADHPLRERLLAQLMLALYRAGRHGEALGVLQDARKRLARELGLEPGPEVRELERRILRHDPALAARPRPIAARVRRRRSLRLAAAAAAAAIAAVAALVASTGGGPHMDAGTRMVAIDARSGAVATEVPVPSAPGAAAVRAGSVWVAQPTEDMILRVDPVSASVVDRIHVGGGQPGSVASGGGAIWVASTVGGAIRRIDPATATVTQTISLGGADVSAIAFGAGRLWVADATDRALIEIEPRTGTARRTLTLDLTPSALAVGLGAVWAAGYGDGAVQQIDARSGETISTIRVGQGPAALAVGEGAVWVANDLDSTVSRIDPRTGSVVAAIPVGSGPSAIAVTAGSVWVASSYSGTVSRVDPRRDAVADAVDIGGRPSSLAAARGRIWVGSASGVSHRGGTLRLVRTGRFDLDPAGPPNVGLSFSRLLYDGLVTFEVAPGPRGLRLVPDLTLAIPIPTDGGMTYTFRLRPGIRYSTGQPLRASDFRRGIERLFRVRSQGASFYAGLVGAAACAAEPRSCDLARGIRTDDDAGSVTFHLRAPDPDFLYKLTVFGFYAPIPPSTPDRITGPSSVPATGPYRVASESARELRLVRNPFFHEWSHAAQPDGNPDEIVWRYDRSFEEEVRDVEAGRADWIFGLLAPAQLRRLQLRFPGQIRVKPSFLVEFFPLNTHRPPFDDVRVRRALNYAIDRATIARLYGGPAVAVPHCQPLTPGMPGFRRYCPYTARPRPRGIWQAPDLARARRLVAASGTRGQRIDVWGTSDGFVPRKVPAYVVSVLRSLGYRTKLHLVPAASISPTERRSFQISVDGDWLPHYPRPSAYLPQFFACHGGWSNGYVCNPRLDREMQEANALDLTDASKAVAIWTRIDHEIVDQAYWVTTVNGHEPEFVSKRVRNYQYSPVGDFIADQVWLR